MSASKNSLFVKQDKDIAYDLLKDIYKGRGHNLRNLATIDLALRLCKDDDRLTRKSGLAVLIWTFAQVHDDRARQMLINEGVGNLEDWLTFSTKKFRDFQFEYEYKSWDKEHRKSISYIGSLDSNIFFTIQKNKRIEVKSLSINKLLEYAYYGETGWVPDPIDTPIWFSRDLGSLKQLNTLKDSVQITEDKQGNTSITKKKSHIMDLGLNLNLNSNHPPSIILENGDCTEVRGSGSSTQKEAFSSLFIIRKVKKKRNKIEDFQNEGEFHQFKDFERKMIERSRTIFKLTNNHSSIENSVSTPKTAIVPKKRTTSFKIKRKRSRDICKQVRKPNKGLRLSLFTPSKGRVDSVKNTRSRVQFTSLNSSMEIEC